MEALLLPSENCSVVLDYLRPLDYIVHGIVQARILEWVAFPFSEGSSYVGTKSNWDASLKCKIPTAPHSINDNFQETVL